MELYDRARHAPIGAEPWSPAAARAAIGEIVADAEAAFDPDRYWPAHPLDDYVPDGATSLYFGAAGMVWGLDHLRRAGVATPRVDFLATLPGLLDRNRAEVSALTKAFGLPPEGASWLFGEPPILLMMMRAGAPVADALAARIAGAAGLPVLELMWGAPGAMLACVFAHDLTGEDRWRRLYLDAAGRLLDALEETPEGPMWTQTLYGAARRYLGLVHGFAGNIQALKMGWDWLSPDQQARVAATVGAVLAANARRSGDAVNWPPAAPEGTAPMLVQVCHGAPGMVSGLADVRLLDPVGRALMIDAGRLTWLAGPPAKGAGLCHGTAGNGYAFLALHALTGETAWLERARAFAMTAIDQHRAAQATYGRGRYSLWTGDLGLAVFLNDCLTPSGEFPTVARF